MPRKARSGPPTAPPESAPASAAQPPRAPTGLPYGEHKALMDTQASVPLPDATAGGGSAGRIQMAIDAAGQQPLGGGNMLNEPSARPGEPLTAGLSMGAGPGPEAIPDTIAPQNPDNGELLRYLPMFEALADLPSATFATRNFVRRMRGSIPPNMTMQSLVHAPQPTVEPGQNVVPGQTQ